MFSLISIARYAFKFPRICFRRTNCEIYLIYLLRRRALLWLMFARNNRLILITDNIFAFRTSFFGDAVDNNPTQWWRNALRNIPCICKLFIYMSNKNQDVLSSTCFLLWYLMLAGSYSIYYRSWCFRGLFEMIRYGFNSLFGIEAIFIQVHFI